MVTRVLDLRGSCFVSQCFSAGEDESGPLEESNPDTVVKRAKTACSHRATRTTVTGFWTVPALLGPSPQSDIHYISVYLNAVDHPV